MTVLKKKTNALHIHMDKKPEPFTAYNKFVLQSDQEEYLLPYHSTLSVI